MLMFLSLLNKENGIRYQSVYNHYESLYSHYKLILPSTREVYFKQNSVCGYKVKYNNIKFSGILKVNFNPPLG